MKVQKCRAFLKWAGGKYGIVEPIKAKLSKCPGEVLVEPFVGAGSVFLNTDYDGYWLNDINPDLINLYRLLQKEPQSFIDAAKGFFAPEFNQADRYYHMRARFNDSQDALERSVLFLYLNRHGYNGLCRYNLSGKFNVPFGRYKAPYFPENELRLFAAKAQSAKFTCVSFDRVFEQLDSGHLVYCDPPYAPISKTANFTSYAGNGFGLEEQAQLAEAAKKASLRLGLSVVISNHDTGFTRKIYRGAKISKLKVSRFISQKGHKRQKVDELIATFSG